MKLSVIIPVYGVEATLNRCVESVLGQHVAEMEVILVDDGSPDRCPQLCDEWAAKDSRIRVIHQENGGLSVARNAGLDIATGSFLTFADSDDWIDDGLYPQLLQQMDDNDILEYCIADRLRLPDHTYEDMDAYWLQGQAYAHTYACNKIYRSSLFDEIRYPKGRVFEDVYILPSLLRKAHKVATTRQGCYHYDTNPNGITATADGQALTQLLEAHLRSQMPIDDAYYMYLVNIQIDIYERAPQKPLMLLPRRLSPGNLHGKQKIKAYALNLLGLKQLCRISTFIHRFRTPSRS